MVDHGVDPVCGDELYRQHADDYCSAADHQAASGRCPQQQGREHDQNGQAQHAHDVKHFRLHDMFVAVPRRRPEQGVANPDVKRIAQALMAFDQRQSQEGGIAPVPPPEACCQARGEAKFDQSLRR
jgi:hypothetical protein